MDPFHANLLLLQSQRLAHPPQPFDCAIRLKGTAADDAEQPHKDHLLFGHSHILGARCAHFRSQLDQSVPVPALSILTAASGGEHAHCHNGQQLRAFAQCAVVQNRVHELRLDLSMLDNALDSFKAFLTFLYGDQQPAVASGSSAASSSPVANPESLLLLSKMFAVPELELTAQSALLSKFLLDKGIIHPLPPPSSSAPLHPPPLLDPLLVPPSLLPSPVSSASSASSSTASSASANNENALPLYAAYMQLHSLIQRQQSLASSASESSQCTTISQAAQSVFAGGTCGAPSNSMDSQCSSSSVDQPPPPPASSSSCSMDIPELLQPQASSGDLLVPSNDKEGWCRNKKYIQIVKKGYRCLVCNKVYGRYNSVSYHVTIYHRNPPIRCEEEGCQFTTREARYIHFHKYYRHQIALPESIDLASRKCPLLGCKHVSKSPAMLDKHIHRHVADCLKEGMYACTMMEVGDGGQGGQCQFRANSHELMYEHLLSVHSAAGGSPEAKDADGPKTTTTRKPPAGASTSAPATPPTPNNARAFPCDQCTFKGRTLVALEQHKMQKHLRGRTGTVPGPAGLTTMGLGGHGTQPHGGMISGNSGLGSIPQFGNSSNPLHSLSLLSRVLTSAASVAGPFGSLPNSPLSPSSSSLAAGGSGLFPASLSLLGCSPGDQQQQHQLLAQLLAAQQLASSLLAAAGSPPVATQQSPADAGEHKLF